MVEVEHAVECLQVYLDYRAMLQEQLDKLALLERRAKDAVMRAEAAVMAKGYVAEIVQGSKRSRWDNKGLRGYAKAHPEVLDFLTESTSKPYVRIRAARPAELLEDGDVQ